MEKGLSDFLAKPIDVSKLDEILDRWIPREKQESGGVRTAEYGGSETEESSADENIPGIDIKRGIAMTGGTKAGYYNVLSMFRKDVENRLLLLKTAPDADNLPVFVTQVHALKSASASVGAAEVSAMAAELEAAGKAGDTAFINEKIQSFALQLRELAEGILAWEISAKENNKSAAGDAVPGNSGAAGSDDRVTIATLLRGLVAVLEAQNITEIDRVMDELLQQTVDSNTKETLEQISDQILMTEFESAVKTAKELIARIMD